MYTCVIHSDKTAGIALPLLNMFFFTLSRKYLSDVYLLFHYLALSNLVWKKNSTLEDVTIVHYETEFFVCGGSPKRYDIISQLLPEDMRIVFLILVLN